MPKHKNPCPGGYEIYNLRRPFLGHQKYILHLSEPCPGVEEKIFKEIMHFHNMTYDIWPRPSTRTPASILHISYHKITSPWSGDHEIYNVLPSYRTDATYQIWYNVKIGPVVLEKKTLTDDAGLTVDDGRRRTPAHGVLNMLSELLR